MSDHVTGIEAIETRLRWLKWIQSGAGAPVWSQLGYAQAVPAYEYVLEHGDTYIMNPHFFRLCDHARQTVPDTLAFDYKWLQSPHGFLWLPEPFSTPVLNWLTPPPDHEREIIRVRAVGWRTIPPGSLIETWQKGMESVAKAPAPEHAIQVCCFQSFADSEMGNLISKPNGQSWRNTDQRGFGCWSYFMLRNGTILSDRIVDFENRQVDGKYIPDPDRMTHPLHEIRWVYTAFYMMAQRLATTLTRATDRATQRRAKNTGQEAPKIYRIVTLRRLEAARQRDSQGGQVDWQWQWEVKGHWRKQTHFGADRPDIYIERYIKGPPDKPVKPGTHTLFIARR